MANMKPSAAMVMTPVSIGYMIPGPRTMRTSEMCIEIITKVELHVAGDADQQSTHPEAEEPVHQRNRHDEAGVEKQLAGGDRDGQIIHRHPQHLRLQNRR